MIFYFLNLKIKYRQSVSLTMLTKKLQKSCKKNSCKFCDYVTCNKYNYNKHITIDKHSMLTFRLTHCCKTIQNIYVNVSKHIHIVKVCLDIKKTCKIELNNNKNDIIVYNTKNADEQYSEKIMRIELLKKTLTTKALQ